MKSKMNNHLEMTTQSWSDLFKLGSASALMMVVIIIIQMIVFIAAPPPYDGTALDWFMLFQKNTLIGLINFEILMVVYTIITIPVALSLYILLRQTNPSWTATFLVLSLTGVMCFIAARPAFEMLQLSSGYAAAGTDAQRAMFLAAGEAKLATFHGTAFHISYILGSITGLIISFIMLKTNIFSKATAYVRIASSVCDFGLYVPTIGIYISIFSVLFLVAWNIMIARRLYQLGKEPSKERSHQIDASPLAVTDRAN